MNVELWKLEDIEPYEDNPVEHGEKQISDLKASIKKFGFKNPLVISPDGVLVAGHARYEAVSQMESNLESVVSEHRSEGNETLAENLNHLHNGEVHCLVTNELTDTEQAEFRIADNKVFEHSHWDRDSLKFELRTLEEAVGFDDDEVKSLLSSSAGKIDYEPGEVEDRRKRLERKYKKLSEDKRERKRGLPCPHCDEMLYLDASQLRSALRRADPDVDDEHEEADKLSVGE